ncbi:MAG: putative multidrug export ATP-binding/permease protein [Syntrophomonadaceae bacterium]|nr:putative multidrug export ATP-binding/permease protein [Bacillota bacterium]
MSKPKRLLIKLIPYWPRVLGAAVSTLAVMGLALIIPQLFRLTIDQAIQGSQAFYLPWIALSLLIFTVIKGVFSFTQRYWMEHVAQKLIYTLRNELFEHLQQLSFSFYDHTQTGQLMSRVTADVEMLKRFFGFGLLHLFQAAITFAGVLTVILVMNWRLSLVTILTLPAVILAIWRFGAKVSPAYQAVQEELAEMTSALQQNLAGIRTVKAFSQEAAETSKFNRHSVRLLGRNLAAVRIWSYYFPLIAFLTGLSSAVILWYGGREVIGGRMMLGELVAFNSYLLMLIMPMRMLGWVVNLSQRAMASAGRVFELLDTRPEVRDLPAAGPLPANVSGRITFVDVSFSYRPGVESLRNISFSASPGQKIAIVGATGSGKTTLVNLIPRHYEPAGGKILLDGEDIRNFTLRSLRSQIGVVSQEIFLFSATIAENIGYGNPAAGRQETEAAAQAAQIHDFILSLPQGYETMVGERGVNLSGGQKQRLAIARALLKDPKILILDDYTSSVDTNTEFLLRRALETLVRGRTCFIIAHRLSSVMEADLILVLKNGAIVASGKHKQLLAESPLYAEIYRLQPIADKPACREGSEL